MTAIPFTKMHGAGNDFVIIDRRSSEAAIPADRLRAIADRRRGVGCDQIVLIEAPRNGAADVRLVFHNADGGEAGACGNGTRCVAAKLMAANGTDTLSIETATGLLGAVRARDGAVTVDMGPAGNEWRDVPLSEAADTLRLDVGGGAFGNPVAVGMGNPHCVFFVEDAEAVDLDRWGPEFENHALFPERTNVEFVTVRPDGGLRMRVWERGVGVTLACGSGVCAVVVAASRRDLISGRAAEVVADGGILSAEWRADDGHVILGGPVATSFTGELTMAEPS